MALYKGPSGLVASLLLLRILAGAKKLRQASKGIHKIVTGFPSRSILIIIILEIHLGEIQIYEVGHSENRSTKFCTAMLNL